MNLKNIEYNWNKFGETDPFWSILTIKEKKYNKWETEEFFKTGESDIQVTMNSLESIGIPIKKTRALDFGCGVGRLTQALSSYFERVDGVDIASKMIEHAKRLNSKQNCFFHQNSQLNLLLFENKSFDLIISFLTLQHMKKSFVFKYLKEFSRLLKPRGIFVFNIPSKIKKINLGKIITPRFLIRIIYKIKKESLMEMYTIKKENIIDVLRESGFEIIKIEDVDDIHYINYKYYCKRI